MNKIEIPFSKSKILLVLLGSISFVFLGILFVLNPNKFVSPIMRNPEIIRFAGISSVLFFGATAIYGTKKMFDKSLGLIIDKNGIFDNSNASSVGLIKWTDITEIKSEQIASSKFLLIFTTNPEFYLGKAKGFKKKLMQGNHKMYGTPLSISCASLKYNFNELEKILRDKLNEQREEMPNY